MMTFQEVDRYNTNSSTQRVCTLTYGGPIGPDQMLLAICFTADQFGNYPTFDNGTLILEAGNTTSDVTMTAVHSKDPGTFVFTTGRDNNFPSGLLFLVSGVNANNPVDKVGAFTSATGTSRVVNPPTGQTGVGVLLGGSDTTYSGLGLAPGGSWQAPIFVQSPTSNGAIGATGLVSFNDVVGETATLTLTSSDGVGGIQFSLNPPSPGPSFSRDGVDPGSIASIDGIEAGNIASTDGVDA